MNLPAQVTALFDFEGAEPGDLSFAAGDVIDVKNAESDGWWTGSVRGKPGSGSESLPPDPAARLR